MNSVLLNAAIDQIIVDLSEPTTNEEENEGWTNPLKKRWRDWFVELKADLKSARPTPPGWGILRAMDFDGVDAKQTSRLTLQTSQISTLLDMED